MGIVALIGELDRDNYVDTEVWADIWVQKGKETYFVFEVNFTLKQPTKLLKVVVPFCIVDVEDLRNTYFKANCGLNRKYGSFEQVNDEHVIINERPTQVPKFDIKFEIINHQKFTHAFYSLVSLSSESLVSDKRYTFRILVKSKEFIRKMRLNKLTLNQISLINVSFYDIWAISEFKKEFDEKKEKILKIKTLKVWLLIPPGHKAEACHPEPKSIDFWTREMITDKKSQPRYAYEWEYKGLIPWQHLRLIVEYKPGPLPLWLDYAIIIAGFIGLFITIITLR